MSEQLQAVEPNGAVRAELEDGDQVDGLVVYLDRNGDLAYMSCGRGIPPFAAPTMLRVVARKIEASLGGL